MVPPCGQDPWPHCSQTAGQCTEEDKAPALRRPAPACCSRRKKWQAPRSDPSWPLMGRSGLLDDEAVDEEHDDGAYDRGDPACAFPGLVPAQRDADVARHEGADDTQDDGHDDAHLLFSGHDGPGDEPYDEPDDDHADDTHGDDSLAVGWTCMKACGHGEPWQRS